MKPMPVFVCGVWEQVAPRAGAWIETHLDYLKGSEVMSPPARGRGLKQARDRGG